MQTICYINASIFNVRSPSRSMNQARTCCNCDPGSISAGVEADMFSTTGINRILLHTTFHYPFPFVSI